MTANNGGPAFPTLAVIGDTALSEGGLTVRDYFAAKALDGMLSCPASDFDDECERRNSYAEYCKRFAESAYEMADAMLAARGSA